MIQYHEDETLGGMEKTIYSIVEADPNFGKQQQYLHYQHIDLVQQYIVFISQNKFCFKKVESSEYDL